MTRLVSPLAIALLALLEGCTSHAPPTVAAPRRTVAVATVGDDALVGRLRVVGVLSPKDEVRLSFKVGGVIDSIGVEEGTVVRKGQLLASLHGTEVEAQVRQAQEAFDKASRDYARGKALYDDGVATREQLDDLGTAAATTRAGLAAARFNAHYARIEAPADGVVLRKLSQAHELVQPGQPVLSVSSLDRGWIVRGAFADRDVVLVHVGDRGEVALDAFPGQRFAATVTSIGSTAEAQSGTYTVEFKVEPNGAPFAQGMVAKVDIARTANDARRLPVVRLTALVEADGDHAYLYVLDGNGEIVHRRDVRLGNADGDRIAISEGLAAGERVVVEGGAFVNDGERVVVADATATR